MNRLLKNLRIIFLIIIILVILFSYFFIFIPLKIELEKSLHNGFEAMVSSSELVLEMHLKNALKSAENLSNRSMLIQKIKKYEQGKINFKTLSQLTSDRYQEGASFSNYLLAAYRYVDGKLLNHYGGQHLSILNDFNFSEIKLSSLQVSKDQKYLVVKSKIKDRAGKKLGSDYLIYDLTTILKEINQLNVEKINYKILQGGIPADSKFKNKGIIENRKLLTTDYYLKAEIPAAFIYDQINIISSRIISIILATIIIISILVIKILQNTSEKIIADLRKELKEKTRLSETDKMLGIYNRAKFNQELEREMQRARRYDNDLALIMVDIDYFKDFNDNFGHHVGDQILKKIVSLISNKIRNHDILARYGGDEFMIICPETEIEAAVILAERLNKTIDAYNYKSHNNLSCSFGVAAYIPDLDDKKSLIKRADQALYQAKEVGRNRVCKSE